LFQGEVCDEPAGGECEQKPWTQSVSSRKALLVAKVVFVKFESRERIRSLGREIQRVDLFSKRFDLLEGV
jgi:hypothetical protein